MKNKRIGILGAGQLAMMLAEAGQGLGLECICLANSANDPAQMTSNKLVVGKTENPKVLKDFFSEIDILIFENEFFSPTVISSLQAYPDLLAYPSPNVMAKLANKLNQKLILQELNIATAMFQLVPKLDPVEEWLDLLSGQSPNKKVLKWAHGGYDGKGNLVYSANSASQNEKNLALEFIQSARTRGVDVYAEDFHDFSCELAMVTVRSTDGLFKHYPLVISQQVEGVCSEVRGPARRFEIPQVMEDKAAEISKSLANYTGLYGSFAIEFFYTKSGELLVNEIAPRVHNSGHFTQNASPCSQFENHLRAAVGMPLGQTESDQYFSMMNILGPVSYYGKVEAPTLRIPGATLHWYGKEDSRPGRKIGHVNLVAADQDQLRGLLAKIQLSLDAWKSLYTPKSISEDK